MYREALVMEVWTAREPPVPEPQSGPVLDILGRLITGSRRAKKERETNRRPAGQAPKAEAEAVDECDHADDTPVINTSLWEERKARGEKRPKAGSPKDDSNDHDKHDDDHDPHQEPQANGDEARAWNGAAPAEQGVLDTTSIGSDHSADQLRTSTPMAADRSSSLQNLELSNVADDDLSYATEKKKPKARTLRSMGASLRSSFRKGLNHNNNLQAAEGAASPTLAKRAPDANSIRSETSDTAAPFDEDDEGRAMHSQTLGGEAKGKGKSKLQRSLSSLSIASITKRSMSMRLASSRATEVFRRIGSMKERGYKKGSYSLEEAACASKLSLQGLDDDVSQRSYTADHNPFDEDDRDDPKDADRAQSPEVEAERESPRLERVAASSITVPRSIFNRWKDQRTLRAFRNLRERSSKKPLEEDVEGWSSQNGRASPVADNPDCIREYLASIGKAHLKADLLGHVKIPIKTSDTAAPFDEDDRDDPKDADRAQSPEVEAERESPRLERVAASSITVPRSIFNRWKDQRTLRAFRNLRERSSKKPLEEDVEGWSSQNGRASPVADNPDCIREYLASIGKAHLKADLLGHVKIPIKMKNPKRI
ncbi:uncharacterized protein LOC134778924 [Penaeus indicus]|uniref:uncharacterized protein LOC134778924 n=1 Tax=Penaeus indicus TaxID=29960 RepID=UPI00300D8873